MSNALIVHGKPQPFPGGQNVYEVGPEGISELVAFWKGAIKGDRIAMRQRYKNGEFRNLDNELMKELIDAYDPPPDGSP